MRKARAVAEIVLIVVLIAALAALWQNFYRESILKAAYPEKYQVLVEKYSAQNGVDPLLIYSVIKNESGFNPNAVSSIGAVGLMQLTPDTFEWAKMLSPPAESIDSSRLSDPEINIRYGTVVLSTLMTEFGNLRTAIAAYHAGRSNVKKWLADSNYSPDGKTLVTIPFADTNIYVGRVLQTEEMYQKLYG